MSIPFYPFTVDQGFHLLPKIPSKIHGKYGKFSPILDSEKHYSTGIAELDKILGGGYPKGCTVLFELENEVTADQQLLFIAPLIANQVLSGKGAFIFPTQDLNAKYIVEKLGFYGVSEKEFARVADFTVYDDGERKPYIISYHAEGASHEENFREWIKKYGKLRSEIGSPPVKIVGMDSICFFHCGENYWRKVLTLDSSPSTETTED